MLKNIVWKTYLRCEFKMKAVFLAEAEIYLSLIGVYEPFVK